MKLYYKTLVVIFALFLGLTSCSDDDDNNGNGTQTTTVVDVALEKGLTSLATALTVTDLVSTLETTGPFTVFAPTNEAFAELLAETGLDLNNLSPAEEDVVRNILLNHVIIGANISSTALVNEGEGYRSTEATNADGDNLSLYFNTTNGVVINGDAEVTDADNTATNGVIHIVDDVIDLPTIATFATANPALSVLVDALDFADGGNSTVPYIDTVSDAEAGPFTVFAPTNDAFVNVLAELGLSGFGEGEGQLNTATTDAVLLVHIASGNVRSTDLPNLQGTIPTLGGNLDLDVSTLTVTDANGREIGIIGSLVDIQAINGVVHAIDTVILPGL
jgi:uncharacterized surface protein with fasciclin (FAS1) repeats